jgi:hypothetical protein
MTRTKRGQGQRRASRQRHYDRPEVYVSVYCAGREDAPHEKWRVATMEPVLQEDGSPLIADEQIVWSISRAGYADPAHDTLLPYAGSPTQTLDGDEWVSGERERDARVFSDEYRLRWSFRCATCGMRRVFKQPSELYGPLRAIAALGIPEVELLHLINANRRAA